MVPPSEHGIEHRAERDAGHDRDDDQPAVPSRRPASPLHDEDPERPERDDGDEPRDDRVHAAILADAAAHHATSAAPAAGSAASASSTGTPPTWARVMPRPRSCRGSPTTGRPA